MALGRERWRLHRGLAQDSLYHQKDVIALLRSGQVTSTTLACPEGGQEWKALLEWPAFAQTDPLQQPMSTKSVVSSADLHVDDGLITNSQLPAMGNWICIYCLIIHPILWLMDTTTTFVGGFENDTELFLCLSGSVLDTIVTAILVVGGLRLRELRRSGPRIVKLALGMSLVILAVFLLIGLPLIAVSIDLQEEIQPMTTGDYLICLMLPIYLVEIVFQIIALTWLIQNGRRMKLVR